MEYLLKNHYGNFFNTEIEKIVIVLENNSQYELKNMDSRTKYKVVKNRRKEVEKRIKRFTTNNYIFLEN